MAASVDQYGMYQKKWAALGQEPRINVACKEDPTKLSSVCQGIIQLDIQTTDNVSNHYLGNLENFVNGSAHALPFPSEHFRTVVLGETLEHCQYEPAHMFLKECFRVLKVDGWLIITYPLDDRPASNQHGEDQLVTWFPGVTSWHSKLWHPEDFAKLVEDFPHVEHDRQKLVYPWGPCEGWGLVLEKTDGS